MLEDSTGAAQLPADVVIPFPPAPRLPVAPVTTAWPPEMAHANLAG